MSTQSQKGGSGSEPVGKGEHVVKQGECLASIAAAHGLLWETIWNHPDNDELKRVRKDPNILLPGDRLHVPKRRLKQESSASEQRHRFRRREANCLLQVCVQWFDEPLANEPYTLDIDGKINRGQTDEKGIVKVRIPKGARQGKLIVGKDDASKVVYDLALGNLDPVSATSGVQQRLFNLGYNCMVTGVFDDQTRGALSAFQRDSGADPTGEIDDRTRELLEEKAASA